MAKLVYLILVSFCSLALAEDIEKGQKDISQAQTEDRVLHFPADRSLGTLQVEAGIYLGHLRMWDFVYKWDNLGCAMGDVLVPSHKRICLNVNSDTVKDLSVLNTLGTDDLYMVSLAYTPADDTCMPYLAHLTGLKALSLRNTEITDKGLAYIKNFKSLEYLTLPKRIRAEGLKTVAELKSLKKLYFAETNITTTGAAQIGKLTALEEFALWDGRINEAGFQYLAGLKNLEHLFFCRVQLGSTAITNISKIAFLRSLDLRSCDITDKDLEKLSQLTKLENLNLIRAKITDQALASLTTMTSLRSLDLQETQITDNGAAYLKYLKSLEILTMPQTGITDKGLAYLSELGNLKYLDITRPSYIDPKMDIEHYTDEGLKELTKLNRLEDLRIGGLGVTDNGISDIAKLTNLQSLSIYGCPITKEGLSKLTSLSSLKKLDVSNSRSNKMTISDLACLNQLKELRELNVHGIIKDNTTINISGLTKLEKLGLTLQVKRKDDKLVQDEFCDEDLASLANLKNLKWLQIGLKNRITDAGMTNLAGLTNMDRLAIGSPYLTDKSLAYLKDMKRMDNMTIAGNITDEGLKNLEELKALTRLVIYSSNNFSPAAINRLKNSLPNLNSFIAEQDKELVVASKKNVNIPAEVAVAPVFSTTTLDGRELNLFRLSRQGGTASLLGDLVPALRSRYAGIEEILRGNGKMAG